MRPITMAAAKAIDPMVEAFFATNNAIGLESKGHYALIKALKTNLSIFVGEPLANDFVKVLAECGETPAWYEEMKATAMIEATKKGDDNAVPPIVSTWED